VFKCGDLIVYGNNGVCSVEEITTLNSDAADKDKLYYVLKNLSSNGVAYIPVDSNVYIRPIMSRDEMNKIVEAIPQISTDRFDKVQPKELQKVYRDALLSYDTLTIISVIKHISITAKRKQLLKRKLSATEDRFLQQGLKVIGSEVSASLDIDINEAKNFIIARLDID